MEIGIPEAVTKQVKNLKSSDFSSFIDILRELQELETWSERRKNLTTWKPSGLGGKIHKLNLSNNSYRVFVQQISENSLIIFQLLTHEDADRYIEKYRNSADINKIHRKNKNYMQSLPTPGIGNAGDQTTEGILILKLTSYSKKVLLNSIIKHDNTKERIQRIEARDFDDIDSILKHEEHKALIKRIFEYLVHKSFISDAESLINDFETQRISIDIDDVEPLTDDNYGIVNQLIKIKNAEDIDEFEEKLLRNITNTNWRDWMLFLASDQEATATHNFEHPTRLLGISGSGKTAILIKRAEYLSKKYPGESVLIVTLNKSLATLIIELLNTAIVDTQALRNISVRCHFDLCKELLTELGEDSSLLNEFSHGSDDHVDAIWKEFYIDANNPVTRVKPVLMKIHDKLLSSKIFPENYIREEFDWIRSSYATNIDASLAYPKAKREGRKTPLDVELRSDLIRALELWNEKQINIGVNDKLRLTSILLSKHASRIPNKYRSILVDECQDFGTTELKLLRMLAKENVNDLFLCGDFAQKISYKNQSFVNANIALKVTEKIKRNYRNTLEILEFATNILENQSAEIKVQRKQLDMITPEFARRRGQLPKIIRAQSMEDEFAFALSHMEFEAKNNNLFKGCIAICGYSDYEIMEFAKSIGIQCLNGLTTLNDHQIFISDLENTKGFEFNDVIILNCSYRSDSSYPDEASSYEEKSTEFNRLYVAMTRARDCLIISHIGTPSDFISEHILHKLKSICLRASLDKLVDDLLFTINPKYKHKPRRIEKLFTDGVKIPPFKIYTSVSEISWEQFLYTKFATGLDSKTTKKLRGLKQNFAYVNVLDDALYATSFRREFQHNQNSAIEERVRMAKLNEKGG